MVKLIITVIASCGDSGRFDKLIINLWKPYIEYLNTNTNTTAFLLFSNEYKNETMINLLKKTSIKDNILVYPVNESGYCGSPGVLQKTLLSFKDILNKYEFDYILRTNLSSFFIYPRLINWIKNNIYDKDILNAYSGVYAPHHRGGLVSGAGFLLSKNLLIEFLNYEHLLNQKKEEDLCISNCILKYCNYTIIEGTRYDILNNIHKNNSDILEEIDKMNPQIYHIRLKSNNLDKDLQILQLLKNKYLT